VISLDNFGSFISDLSVALFAFIIWFQQKTDQKTKLYIDIQKEKRTMTDADLLIINSAFILSDKNLIEKMEIAAENKDFLKRQLTTIYKIDNFYNLLLLFFALGIVLQAFNLIMIIYTDNILRDYYDIAKCLVKLILSCGDLPCILWELII